MKVVAIIQARMGSSRLPGKVMRLLHGKSVLAHVVERVSACNEVDDVVVATTDQGQDRKVVMECMKLGVNYYRGSEDDVLDRYYQSAQLYKADIIVRVTSDCPLFDPKVLDAMLGVFKASLKDSRKVDYLSNTQERTFPRGLDAEIITFSTLEKVWQEAEKLYEREHVTPYIYENPNLFNIMEFQSPQNYSSMRWTLDTQEDWCFIKSVFDNCYSSNEIFSTEAVLDLLKKFPHLQRINAAVRQKSLTG